jgi:hypothetical protein
MKKSFLTLFAAFAAVAIFSCSPEKGVSVESDPHVFGKSVDSSANIDAIKASFKDVLAYDTTSYKAKYADSAIFHDNMTDMTLNENVAIIKKAKALGITIKFDSVDAIWEEVLNKPNEDGIKNGVISFATATWTRDGKSVTVKVSQVDAFNKDGKIVEEWLTYDTSGLNALWNN